MNGRVKFQVWSYRQIRWRTAYCRPELLIKNRILFNSYGFMVREL